MIEAKAHLISVVSCRVPGDTKIIINNQIKSISLETKKLKAIQTSSMPLNRSLRSPVTCALPQNDEPLVTVTNEIETAIENFSLNSNERSVSKEPIDSDSSSQVCKISLQFIIKIYF